MIDQKKGVSTGEVKTPLPVSQTGKNLSSEGKQPTPKKLSVKDAAIDDNKIPRNLILMYGDTPYIMKAGLEWKANKLFGGAGYSLAIEPVTVDFKENIFVFRAVLKVLANGAEYVNYGEARTMNANSLMQKQLFHLAITRAECRVLRMATACGYASYDEVMTMNGTKELPQLEDGNKPATEAQIQTLKSLGIESVAENVTKQQAAERIKELSSKKK